MWSAVVIASIIVIFAIMNTQSVNLGSGASTTNIATTSSSTAAVSGKYDAFAECLTKAGAAMYGASWCPHCQEQKSFFGSSFQYIKYVECPDNTQVCIDKGVQGYPTWIMGTSTKIYEGFDDKTMKTLSQATGCVLP